MSEPVAIVDYDHRWPARYEEERAKILKAIGDKLVLIEHIGSTAVLGLAAKPIIDIMAAVRRLADAEACIGPLQRIGYQYVPEYELELPERRYFHKGSPESRMHHLHIVEITSDFWRRHLLFRDYLRAHLEVAREYEGLKRRLAERHRFDRQAYTEAKTEFVQAVVERAGMMSQ